MAQHKCNTHKDAEFVLLFKDKNIIVCEECLRLHSPVTAIIDDTEHAPTVRFELSSARDIAASTFDALTFKLVRRDIATTSGSIICFFESKNRVVTITREVMSRPVVSRKEGKVIDVSYTYDV